MFDSVNRKEGNDLESIQLFNNLRPRHHRERKTHLNGTTVKSLKAESQKNSLFPKNLATRLSKIKQEGHDGLVTLTYNSTWRI